MAHWFTDIAAQGRDAFFDWIPNFDLLAKGAEPFGKCLPKALGGPVLYRFSWCTLNIVPAARFASHARKGETVLVIGVDHIVCNRGLVDQDTKPAKGIFALKFL